MRSRMDFVYILLFRGISCNKMADWFSYNFKTFENQYFNALRLSLVQWKEFGRIVNGMERNRNWVENWNWSLIWYHQRNETEKWWTARCQGQVERQEARADGKDGSFLGISPLNGEKCISLLLHYRPIPGNSIFRPKFKINSPKQGNSISLYQTPP